MIEIAWMLTDDIGGVSKEEFDSEWNEVYGYFELSIEQKSIGFCPKRELFPNEEGSEMILYWFINLLKTIINLKNGNIYEFQLLSMNLKKLIFNGQNSMSVQFVGVEDGKIEWNEVINYDELHNLIIREIDHLLLYVQQNNKDLLLSKRFTELMDLFVIAKMQ